MSPLIRFLKKPKTIVGEVGLLVGLFAVSTIVPSDTGEGALAATAADAKPLSVQLFRVLGLDHLFTSPLFGAVVALAMASLVVVLIDQISRAWRLWSQTPRKTAPSGAPYRRAEFFPGPLPEGLARMKIRVRGAFGVWGSPLFHLGILLIILAGVLRMLFGADAVVDLMAGETLLPRSDQYGKQWPGLLARPFAFPVTVRLEDMRVTRYPSGEIRWAEAVLRLGDGPDNERTSIAINAPVSKAFHTLYLRTIGGAAALVEVGMGPAVEHHAILLKDAGRGAEGKIALDGGTILRATIPTSGIGNIPERIDFRLIRDGALAGAADLSPSGAVTLPDGTRLLLEAIVPWAQFSGRRDIATPVVYIGFLFACAGGLLMTAVVRVESGTATEPTPGGWKLTVWMLPQRFTPLFAQEFEELWIECRAEFGEAQKGNPVS